MHWVTYKRQHVSVPGAGYLPTFAGSERCNIGNSDGIYAHADRHLMKPVSESDCS